MCDTNNKTKAVTEGPEFILELVIKTTQLVNGNG